MWIWIYHGYLDLADIGIWGYWDLTIWGYCGMGIWQQNDYEAYLKGLNTPLFSTFLHFNFI
jgi:hypothetical protein